MTILDLGRFRSVAVHHDEWTMEGCVDVLCEEWGRSRNCRKVMLNKSCEDLPYNIALVCEGACLREILPKEEGERVNDEYLQKENGERVKDGGEVVIGHSRLSSVVGRSDCAFVESVVIRRCFRSCGLGKKLMQETEKHAKRLGIRTLYLTTIDKQSFYHHLGYLPCKPIVSMGPVSKLLSQDQLLRLFGSRNEDLASHNDSTVLVPSSALPSSSSSSSSSLTSSSSVSQSSQLEPHPSIPPPPPPPSLPPSPPLLPPPPPPSLPPPPLLPPPPPPSLPPPPPPSLPPPPKHSPQITKSQISPPLKSNAFWMKKEFNSFED